MVTDDVPGRKDTYADFSSSLSAAAAGHGWSTVPADWFESEPAAGRLRADFLELCRRASAEQITAALEGIWLMLDRAALWVSSIHADLAADSTDFLNRTCAVLLPAIPRRIRTLTCLGPASLDHMPTAMAAARATFVNGQVAVSVGGQLKVPTPRGDHRFLRRVPPCGRACRGR